MQVRVVSGGDTALRALMYKPLTETARAYISDKIDMATTAIGNYGGGFIDQVKSVYNTFNSDAAINAAKSLLYNANSHLDQTAIYGITPEYIPQANLTMQRYIMAQPDIYNMYRDNMVNGFEETFVDTDEFEDPTHREDYRVVMNGSIKEFEDGTPYITTYNDVYEDGSETIDMYEKFAVMKTWDSAMSLLADGIDPTDPNGGDI